MIIHNRLVFRRPRKANGRNRHQPRSQSTAMIIPQALHRRNWWTRQGMPTLLHSIGIETAKPRARATSRREFPAQPRRTAKNFVEVPRRMWGGWWDRRRWGGGKEEEQSGREKERRKEKRKRKRKSKWANSSFTMLWVPRTIYPKLEALICFFQNSR